MEFKDEYVLEQYVGKTFSDKLNDELAKYWIDRKFKKLGFVPRPGFIGSIMNIKDNEILGLGGSDPLDVANDNFGKFIAGMCSAVSATSNIPAHGIGSQPNDEPVKDDGTSDGIPFFYDDQFDQYNQGGNGQVTLAIGNGGTPPDQSDFAIEGLFTNPPMNSRIGVGDASYTGTGVIKQNANFGPSAEAGIVRELAMFMGMKFKFGPGDGNASYMLSHDAISPNVIFGLGDTLLAQYNIQI